MIGPALAVVLEALERTGARTFTRGDSTRAQCPAHGSRSLTLSLRQGDRGAMVTCFAGCELDSVLDALSLTRRDLFDTALPPGYTPPPRVQPTPWDPITRGPGTAHLLDRIAQLEAAEEHPDYWTHRAAAFEAATSRPGDWQGIDPAARAARAARDLECAATAAACRRRAAVAAARRGGRP